MSHKAELSEVAVKQSESVNVVTFFQTDTGDSKTLILFTEKHLYDQEPLFYMKCNQHMGWIILKES